MLRNLVVGLASFVTLTSCPLPASGQCQVSAWGGAGGGAVAGQGFTASFAVAGIGSKFQSVSVPTTGGASTFAEFDIGTEIRKIRAIGGSMAWVTDGASIWTFDRINAASNPLRLLSTFSPAGGVRDMLPVGSLMYTWNSSTLRVVDYANPTAPVVVSSTTLPFGTGEAAFLNNRLYMLTSAGTVAIFDATNLAAPALLNTFPLSPIPALTVNSAPSIFSGGGSLVHLAFYSVDFSTNTKSLRVVDFNNDQPTGAAGGTPVSGTITQIAGDMLIQPQTLSRINWSNPLAPAITPIYSEPGSRFKSFGTVTSSGVTRAYIAAGEGGFLVVNTNTGTLQARHLAPPSAAFESAFVPGGGDLMVADGLGGLRTALLTDGGPSNRSFNFVGGSANPGVSDLVGVACGDGFALTSNRTQVQKFNTASPSFPVFAGSYPTDPTNVVDVAASGIAGLVLRNSGFGSTGQLDLINCTAIPPVLASSQSFPLVPQFAAKRIRAFDDLAVVVERQHIRLFSFDHAAPMSLATRGVIDVASVFSGAGDLQDAAVSGDRLYLLSFTGTLFIYDIANPDAPALIAFKPCRTGCTGMALSGDWIGIVGSFVDQFGSIRGAIDFINILDKANPTTVSSAQLPSIATSVAVHAGPSGPHFAASCALSGIRVFAAPSNWAPTIVKDPLPATTCPGGTAEFTLTALIAPGSTPEYQWRRTVGDHTENIPGATSPTLTLINVTLADLPYSYSCIVSNGCGLAVSHDASLTICRADVNCSGEVSVQDIFDFLALFFAGDSAADFNGAAGVTVQDMFDFLAAYFTGCA